MADRGTQTSIVSQEEANYMRISLLLLRVAPPAVRVKFDTEFDPDILQRTLDRERHRILLTLKRKRIINQAQWDKLFPPGGKAKSTSFDLSLMICLIRHLTSIPVSDQLPFPADESNGAHLSRLKFVRNELAHSQDGILSTDFEEYWTYITNAIVKFGGNHFRQRCCDLKMSTLDENYKEILVEIRNTSISNDPIPRGLRRIHGDLIESWEKEKVVVTRAIRQIDYLIKRNDIVTAVGSSGCGKSTAIHFVALQLHRKNGYDIVPVYTPEEVRQYYDPEYKQVFVIDDIWGKSTKDTYLVNSWERLSNDVEIILKSRAVKILSSCRKYLCGDLFKNLTFLSNSICDLSLDYCLTNRERIEIASTFLTEAEVKVIAESNIYGIFDYFPLLCRLYFARKPVQILDFFNNPLQFIKDDFKLLLNTKNSKTIATLMLFVVYNNDLNANVLLETVFEKRILKEIAESFCLKTPFSSEDVQSELNSLKHSYVKQYGNSYSMCHDKVFEIFLSFLCENKLTLILKLAHTYVIRDRFLFESLRENETDQHVIDHVIIIPETTEQVYFSRLLRDIIDGFIANVLWNKQNKHFKFRQRLVHLITERVSIQKYVSKLSTDEIYELLSSTISQGYCEFVTLLLLDHVDINHCIPFMGTPLYIAIGKGHIDIVKLLLYKKANPQIKYLDRTPLFLAVEKGHLDIIRLLLQHKADPNIASLEGTPLYRAVEHGYADIVKLLLDNKAIPNIKHTNGIPDYVVTQDGLFTNVSKRNSGNEECIISCGTPLHKAVENYNMELVKLLLDHNADPNIIGFRGTPLYIAAEHGKIDIVKLLLHFEAHPDIVSNSLFKATPLFRAAEKGYIDIVKILLDHYADPFIPYNDETPLTIAKSNGYSDIAELVGFGYSSIISEQEWENERKKQHRLSDVSSDSRVKGPQYPPSPTSTVFMGTETSLLGRDLLYSTRSPRKVNSGCKECGNYETSGIYIMYGKKNRTKICFECEKKSIERKDIIKDIKDTEESYGRDLVILKEHFFKPMKSAGMLSLEHLEGIFLNLDVLIHVNTQFVKKLQGAVDIAVKKGDENLRTMSIGNLFLDSSSMILAFENYCVHQGQAAVLLEQLEREKEMLRIFLKVSQDENPVLRRMPLTSFLMVPVQRMIRYPLLLERLYKFTSGDHTDKSSLMEAKLKIEDILDRINSKTKHSGTLKLRRKISENMSQRISITEKIEVNKVAIDILGWNMKEVCDIIISRLQVAPLSDQTWAAKRLKTMKFSTVHCVLLTLGQSDTDITDNDEDNLLFARKSKVIQTAVVLIKEKNGKYQTFREPFMLNRCVVSIDPDVENAFELSDLSRDSYVFKGEDLKELKSFLQTVKQQTLNLASWRKRRNALPNIMIKQMV